MSVTGVAHRELLPASFKDVQHAKTHELPVMPVFFGSHVSRECPVSLVYPVSNGQGLDKQVENMLKAFASRNACTQRNTARKKLWKLARDLKAVEKGTGRELPIAALMVAFNEWHRLSEPFLDLAKTSEDYFAELVAALGKVRIPTGEGDTLNKALEAVAKLSLSELPVIPGMADASEGWRRVAALHREISRLCGGRTYFLSYRDAAKAHDGLNHQSAYNITFALARLGVVKVVRKGQARASGGKAAEFRYLLSQGENGRAETAA
jgi:hypothetical protein